MKKKVDLEEVPDSVCLQDIFIAAGRSVCVREVADQRGSNELNSYVNLTTNELRLSVWLPLKSHRFSDTKLFRVDFELNVA